MKKIMLALALFGAVIMSSNNALATNPCAKYNVTAQVAGCAVNGHALTVGVPFAFSDGDVLTVTLAQCAGGRMPTITTFIRGYVFVPPSTWALSDSVVTLLPVGCENATYILHTNTDVNCATAIPSAAVISSYCPCWQ